MLLCFADVSWVKGNNKKKEKEKTSTPPPFHKVAL
jgi:hypothetical protein